MHYYARLEGGETHWKLCWLPVVNGGAEPHECGGIARAWIRRYTPVCQWPNDGIRARGDSGGYRQQFC